MAHVPEVYPQALHQGLVVINHHNVHVTLLDYSRTARLRKPLDWGAFPVKASATQPKAMAMPLDMKTHK